MEDRLVAHTIDVLMTLGLGSESTELPTWPFSPSLGAAGVLGPGPQEMLGGHLCVGGPFLRCVLCM